MSQKPDTGRPASEALAPAQAPPEFGRRYFALLDQVLRVADQVDAQPAEATRDALHELVDRALTSRAEAAQDGDEGLDR